MTDQTPEYIYDLVKKERSRQRIKWERQYHPLAVWSCILTEETGEVAQAILKMREAASKGDPTSVALNDLIDEVVQVAAVCIQFLEILETGFYPNDFDNQPEKDTDNEPTDRD